MMPGSPIKSKCCATTVSPRSTITTSKATTDDWMRSRPDFCTPSSPTYGNGTRSAVSGQLDTTVFWRRMMPYVCPYEPSWSRAVYHLYVIRTDNRDGMMQHLKRAGIGTGIHYPVPLHLQKAYASLNYDSGRLSGSGTSCGRNRLPADVPAAHRRPAGQGGRGDFWLHFPDCSQAGCGRREPVGASNGIEPLAG